MIVKSYQPRDEVKRVPVQTVISPESREIVDREAARRGWTRSAMAADLLEYAISQIEEMEGRKNEGLWG